MGSFRVRRSIRLGPGIKLNLTKTGLGLTAGVRGAHYSVHSSGRRTKSVGIPGTGFYYQDRSGGGRSSSAGGRRSTSARAPDVQTRPLTAADVVPRPGLFASAPEKRYHDAVLRYLAGDEGGALAAFEACLAAAPATPSAHLIAYICGSDGRRPEADRIAHLEAIVQGHDGMPDHLQAKYLPEPWVQLNLAVRITELISATVPFDTTGAALILAERYQEAGRLEEAIGLVHQLHEIRPDDAAIRLSLADLLLADRDADGVLEATSTAKNESDLGVALLQFRAAALLLSGHPDGAIATLTEALAKTSGRAPELLKAVRYDRALALNDMGQARRAKADLERVYAIDPAYEDVKARLEGDGLSRAHAAPESQRPPERRGQTSPPAGRSSPWLGAGRGRDGLDGWTSGPRRIGRHRAIVQ